jgi:hypothetical protein
MSYLLEAQGVVLSPLDGQLDTSHLYLFVQGTCCLFRIQEVIYIALLAQPKVYLRPQ